MTSNSLDLTSAAPRQSAPRTDVALTALIPCFNEEACLERAYREIHAELCRYDDHELLFVDDGSTDGTLALIRSFAETDHRVRYISFTRNFGLEAAFSAGFRYAGKPWTVQLDADLQSPPKEIHRLIDAALTGYDIVFGVRPGRRDPWVRRMGSLGQQAVARRLLGISVPVGASVFRVARTSVARKIVQTNLRSPYFIATAPLLGARYTTVPTAHQPRTAGVAKWNLARLVAHATELWIGFSVRPLAAVSWAAVAGSLGSLALLVLLALHRVGALGVAVAALLLSAAAFLGLGVLIRYLLPVLAVRTALPRYLIRESNIRVEPADDLYEGERAADRLPSGGRGW